jgi:hypothetical protein
VLDDLEERPEGIARARRFLAVHLDGLERIATRLEAGATPPPAFGVLLRDLETAARRLRDDLRAEESAALDIQVKVLADRLREEGYSGAISSPPLKNAGQRFNASLPNLM